MTGRVTKIAMLLLLSLSIGGMIGCTKEKAPRSALQQPVELHVSAAVSLKDALTEIRKTYQAKASHIRLVYNFGSSGSLQRQVEQGAPADIFISAAPKQMDELAAKKMIKAETRKNLAENKLVVIVPKDSKLAISAYEDLNQEAVQKIALGETNTVPAGQYAAEVLQKLGIWNRVKEKAVFTKDVRTVLAYTETGNVDAGIVYQTDAASSDRVKIAAMAPAGSHQPIFYPIAVIAGSRQETAAQDFIAYLFSSESKAILEKHGFVITN